jgi:hypothetical protein
MGHSWKRGTGGAWLIVAGVVALVTAGCGSSGNTPGDAGQDGKADGGGGHAGSLGPDGSAGSSAGADGAAGGAGADSGGTGGAAGASGADAGDASGGDTGVVPTDGGDARLDVAGDVAVDVPSDRGLPDVAETAQAPAAPTALSADVADRRQTSFQLSWTAPAASYGGAVWTYQVRFARDLITAGNFDDTTKTSPAPYAAVPANPGQADGVLVQGLDIETDYFFAVAAVDAFGNRSTIVATTVAVRAKFNVTILSGMAMDNSGFDLNGSADLGTAGTLAFQPDGRSDLMVGATAAKTVYVFFGTATGYTATPSITITGSTTGFGRSVADAGDLDGDGLDDLAITSPNDNGGRVYIFSRKNPPASWGSTTSWPAALTDAQANYVITSTGALAGSMTGRGLARLGDFDGGGGDDLAISYNSANALNGSVVIVKGGASFGSRTLPDATNAIEIDGAVAGGAFGAATLGIGKFLPSAGTTLLVTASVAGTSYAFGGHAPAGGVMTSDAADDSTAGSGTDRYGAPIAYLGPLGSSPGAFALAAVQGRYVDVELGTAATGPFLGAAASAPAPSVRFVDALAGNSFGVVAFGSGVRGTSQVKSFIGDATPDLVLAGQAEQNNAIYIVNGSVLGSLSGMIDVSTPSMATIPGTVRLVDKLPADWGNGYTTGALINDLDGDGHADFAIGEFVSAKPGRVAVFY